MPGSPTSSPETDDGKVSVERAQVEGMADFLVLPYSHPFIMNAAEVIDQTLHFLRGGRFGTRPPSAEVSSEFDCLQSNTRERVQ